MAEDRLAHNDVINRAGALLSILRREYSADLRNLENRQLRQVTQLGPVNNTEDLLDTETERIAWQALYSQMQQEKIAQNSQMTIASFVENKFVPEHVALKRSSGRAHYKAMLKHVIKPEEVDRMLSIKRKRSGQNLKTVPGWPYLSDMRLCDTRPEHVSRLISAASARGYSVYTVTHLRNIISAIFSHAKQEQYFSGDNPASLVKLPEIRRKQACALTLAQARDALEVMMYPEREMTLLTVFTGMNLAEILGLQWKQVNLTQVEIYSEDDRIPPRTIAVKNQLYRRHLEGVKKNRVRNLPIPKPLLQILLQLRGRERFIGPDDFVLVSQVGTTVNQTILLARRLRPIAQQLGVPSLSCQAFSRIRKVLASELGKQFHDFTTNVIPFASHRENGVIHNWHSRAQRREMTMR